VTADPNVADPNSEEILYTWPQPFSNHNGGDLEFGPDGYLYVGFGDGGSGGDPNNHAQSLDDPLGDMIRIDVSGASGYTVPPDNPWVGAQDT
ncbi:MAG: PQQ-dependent sugar dehydrogenase, partial [Flavobacteriales bacterium]|nr:PQQ-dependent sugar dehydrogenase [Flavobacteriales bacterium]